MVAVAAAVAAVAAGMAVGLVAAEADPVLARTSAARAVGAASGAIGAIAATGASVAAETMISGDSGGFPRSGLPFRPDSAWMDGFASPVGMTPHAVSRGQGTDGDETS